ncbi:hypothetical protein [Streptomyces adelaidensis]|uniref:hypothetical protein n=1 Tax=Streptomyces adelaidensis TaxID=2796465 RepID=UPI001907321B|nr:hypothetical protein [Streptomyces adelaidensis]
MLNNQIIIADDTLRAYARRNQRGIVDAVQLTESEWAGLCTRNINSTRAQIVRCGFCWVDHGETQWMKTFNRMGTRVVSHQAGEALDHPYQSVETPEHKAYNNRTFHVWDREGFGPRKEARAEDGSSIADVLAAEGIIKTAYEHQHSPFKKGHGLTERMDRAAAVGRVAMFHTDQVSVARAQKGPILRTDGDVPFEWIEDLNRPLTFRSGLREIIVFTCDVRNGVWCPRGKISGCGRPHARTELLGGVTLDDVLRGAPMGEYVPVFNAQVTEAPYSFWTTRESYGRYLSALNGRGATPLDGAPAAREKTRKGARNGHSGRKEAELAAMQARAIDLSTLATPSLNRPVAPSVQRRPSGVCSHWIGAEARYCNTADGVRRYLPGYRCPAHTPRALQGLPEFPPGPGIPAYRKAER